MKTVDARKIAGVLNVLVGIALVCNVIAVYMVPTIVLVGGAQNLVGHPHQWGGLRGTLAAWGHGWIWFGS